MGMQDDSMLEVAEYLREEARVFDAVGPRRYEHWEVLVLSPKHRESGGKWVMMARWMLRRAPMDPATKWILDLAKHASKGKVTTPHSSEGATIRFEWDEGEDDEQGRGTGRASQSTPRRDPGEEKDSGDLDRELSVGGEETERDE